jgi:PAS domain S-box-containing protein
MEGSLVRDAAGRPLRLLGITRDITERKHAERVLAERTAQLALAGQAGLVGSYAYDMASGVIQISAGFATIYGLPEGTEEIMCEDWRVRLHPDDLAAFELGRARAFANRRSELHWEYRIRRPDGEIHWIEQRSLITYDQFGTARRSVGVQIDVTERKRNEEHQSLLVAELDHRVKNALAVVSVLIARSRETSGSVAELVAALDGRIKSMATAHELLSGRNWHGLPLRGLIERELEPYAMTDNMAIDGPDLALNAEAGQALAMVVHELVTNAAKYGALSVERGRVSVCWRLAPENGSGAHLALDWPESHGPTSAPSARAGYGTSVIRDLIPYELGGHADLAFPPEGVRCRLQIPARWLSPNADREPPALNGSSTRPTSRSGDGANGISPLAGKACPGEGRRLA